jgi:hypothetical protein
VDIGRIAVVGLVSGLFGVVTSGTIVGWLFHPFQARTPQTWRPDEGPVQYAISSVLTVVMAMLVVTLYAALRPALSTDGWRNGLSFGALCWVTFVAPVLLSNALFVNLHRGFVAGLMLSWLIVTLLAAGAAGWWIPVGG